MTEYRRMYTTLFNGITDALDCLQGGETASAAEILKRAQIHAEELYLAAQPEKRRHKKSHAGNPDMACCANRLSCSFSARRRVRARRG